MSGDALKESEFRRLRELLENEPGLREIVDSATSREMRMPKYQDWLIPYVSAPRLKGSPWK